MECARARVLAFLHADPSEYDVVFTANASGALRLVGEGFPFGGASRFVLTADNHNSVNGIRCFAERAGAAVRYVPLRPTLRAEDPEPWLAGARRDGAHLFAYPAQSNFSGVRHPLQWIERAKGLGYSVLLDAAALAPTCPLRLDRVSPDFVTLSFYKLFGFPTGVGALVARRDAIDGLGKAWFAGGTVEWVSTQHSGYALRAGSGALEEGTPDFLAFDAVRDGLDWLDRIGMPVIASHVRRLTALLLGRLTALRHAGGGPLVEIYGPCDCEARGGTVSFNVLDPKGRVVPFDDVVSSAARRLVSVRGGCFCNPGCAEAALGFVAERARACRAALGSDLTADRFSACLGGPVGAVRASVGVPTTPADIDRLMDVLEGFRDPGSAAGAGEARRPAELPSLG